MFKLDFKKAERKEESEVTHSCLTLWDPMVCSLPASSVHGIFQVRVLEWVAISLSRGSSRPRDWTRVSCIAGRHFTIWATREAQKRQRNKKSNGQHPVRSHKKQENSRKTYTSASLTMLKPLSVWITTNCGKFFKRWDYQTTLPASRETRMEVKKQQLEPDMEQRTGSKLGKEYVKAVYCHPTYITYMQNTSCKMPG